MNDEDDVIANSGEDADEDAEDAGIMPESDIPVENTDPSGPEEGEAPDNM